MTELTISHPALTNQTCLRIINDLEALIHEKYLAFSLLFLPFTQNVIEIACLPGDFLGRDIPPLKGNMCLFYTEDDFLITEIPPFDPEADTNYLDFREKLFSYLETNLNQFLEGKLVILITPPPGYPMVQVQKCRIDLRIAESKSMVGVAKIV